jgi:hypothetical protein
LHNRALGETSDDEHNPGLTAAGPALSDSRGSHAACSCSRAQSGEEPPRPDIVQLRSLLEDAADGAGSTGDVAVNCPHRLTARVIASPTTPPEFSVVGLPDLLKR